MKILSQLSGGYDSVAVLCKLLSEGKEVKCVFFDYGQKYLKQELSAISYVNDFFEMNPLYKGAEIIKVPLKLQRMNNGSPSDYIPIRNVVFASLSANIAIANGINYIAVGNKTTIIREDDPYSFKDCSRGFYSEMTRTINNAMEKGDSIEFIMPLLHSPILAMSKGEVVEVIYRTGLNFNKLWSCYSDGETPCGICYHCQENEKAFEEAGLPNPIKYS